MTKPKQQHLLVLTMAPRCDQRLAVCSPCHATDRHGLGCATLRLYMVTGLPTLLLTRILLETMLVTADTRQLVFSTCENHTQGTSRHNSTYRTGTARGFVSGQGTADTQSRPIPMRPGCRVFFEGGVLNIICTSSTSWSAASKGAQILAVSPFPASLFPFPTWSEAMLFCFSH